MTLQKRKLPTLHSPLTNTSIRPATIITTKRDTSNLIVEKKKLTKAPTTLKEKVKGNLKERATQLPKVITTPIPTRVTMVKVKANPRDMVEATLGTITLLCGINRITIAPHHGTVIILLHGKILTPTQRGTQRASKATKDSIKVQIEVKTGPAISQATTIALTRTTRTTIHPSNLLHRNLT
jgi:hypothetical protein